MTYNHTETARFLEILAPGNGKFVFQTFDDSPAKQGTIARTIYGAVEDCIKPLEDLCAQGAGVFVTINETDGSGRRKSENVTAVRAVFVDTDGAPLKPILQAAKDAGLPPSIVVESSPGNYHVYWRAHDCSLAQFKPIQQALAKEFGTDQSVCDLPRVLRLPGFPHQKGEPFQVRIIYPKPEASTPPPVYMISEIIERFNLQLTRTRPAVAPREAYLNSDLILPPQPKRPPPAETPEAIEEVRRMLAVIPADCSRDEWLRVIFALLALGWNCSREEGRQWSITALNKFDQEDFDKVCASFRPDGGIGYGTLEHIARQHGWVPQAPAVELEVPGGILAGRFFAARNRGLLCYVSQVGKWLRWDGFRWKWCERGEEMAAAKECADVMLDKVTAQHKQDPDGNKKRMAFALGLQNLNKLQEMVELAKSEPGMCIENMTGLDGDAFLLGVRNGVVDLRTGKLIASDPKQLITRQAGAAFDLGAECPQWERFLLEVMDGDSEAVGAIQRACGYTLTGSTLEEVMIVCVGHGANGKSVFANAMTTVLGEYAQTAPPSLLTVGKDGAARNDVARTCGARLLQVNELQNGDRLDEQVVKLLAGRERISARFLHREFFEFWPTAKPWLRTNHRPIIVGTDEGIWRRIILIPFRRKFSEDARDGELEQKLMAERDGILRWMVEGCMEWRRIGLALPDSLKRELGAYRSESDVLGEFLADMTRAAPGERAEQSALFTMWRTWCERNGFTSGAKKSFTRRLAERGHGEVRSGSTRFYSGLASART